MFTMPHANTSDFQMGTVDAPEWNGRLFIDLDGTLADFTGQFHKHFNVHHNTLTQPEIKKLITDHGSFYRGMPLLMGALDFFNRYRYLDPILLGACVKTNFDVDALDKRQWVQELLSENALFIPCYGSSSKHLYLQKPGDILVDDFDKNIKRWTEAGGIGIHHQGDFAVTTAALDAILRPSATEPVKVSRERYATGFTE